MESYTAIRVGPGGSVDSALRDVLELYLRISDLQIPLPQLLHFIINPSIETPSMKFLTSPLCQLSRCFRADRINPIYSTAYYIISHMYSRSHRLHARHQFAFFDYFRPDRKLDLAS